VVHSPLESVIVSGCPHALYSYVKEPCGVVSDVTCPTTLNTHSLVPVAIYSSM
jgi:hypothetical protein